MGECWLGREGLFFGVAFEFSLFSYFLFISFEILHFEAIRDTPAALRVLKSRDWSFLFVFFIRAGTASTAEVYIYDRQT